MKKLSRQYIPHIGSVMKPFGLFVLILGLVLGYGIQTEASPLVQDILENQKVEKDPSQLGSLTKVPQSTGLYFSTMNHEALFATATKSNAWQAIKKSKVAKGMKSAYRRGRTKGYAEYNEENPFAQYLKFYGDTFDNFIFQSGWEVASQIIGNEMFIYVDNDMADFIQVARKAQNDVFQYMADEMDFDDLEGSKISDETTIEIATAMLKNLTDVACPTVIIGSRLEDPDGFKGMLELAQAGAESGMNELPPEAEFLRDSWKVIDEENNFFMTLNLNLAELPLEEMLAEVNDAELVAAIEEFVLNKQCSVALGIRDNLLLLGIANNAEKLTKFGSQDKLIDLPQLAQLNESIQKNDPIIGAYYLSEEFSKAQFSFAEAMEDWMPLLQKGFTEGFSEQAETSQAEAETMSKELASSLLELAEDLKTVWPEPALRYGFAKLDAEGIRGHTFRGSKHPFLDGSKPLELADHAGPETVLLLANRPRDLSKQYGLGAKWVSRCYQALKARGIEEAIDAVEKARAQQQKASGKSGARDLMEDDPPEVESPEVESPEENQVWREKGPKIIDLLESIAKKIDQTTRQRFLPAIDGQEVGLFVELVDGPKSWHPDIPQTETLLPLPLPALITEHNDQADLVLAAEEYLDHAAEFYKGVEAIDAEFPEDKSEVTPDQTWKFTMEKSETTLGTLFQLPVVPESKLDSSVRPGVLITKDKMVAAVLQKQAADLSQPRTANLFGPASEKKPSFSVFFYDNRALMKGIETWNTIALEVAEEAALEQDVSFDLSQYEAERDTLQFSEEQLKDYFQGYWNLGGCWKGISSRSYAQGEGAAADFLLKFSDVEPVK